MSARVPARIYIGSVKFFRNRLLVLDADGISNMVDAMDKETRNIRQDILKLCWYMRGGVTYEEAMQMSQSERNAISAIIKENLDTTKRTNLPFF